MALYQMLAERFQVCATITGADFHRTCYVNTVVPARYQWILGYFRENRSRRRVFDYWLRMEESFGAKDFLAHDPQVTVANILRYRGAYRELQELYNKVQDADLLIIHGEGDFVFTTPPRREVLFLLGMAELGLHLQKKVVYANGLMSDCPTTGRNRETLGFARNILSRCNTVLVRDYQSLEFVKTEIPGAKCALVPDSLFTWYPALESSAAEIPANGDYIIPFPEHANSFGKLDFAKPYICVGGSALAAKDMHKSAIHFTTLYERIKGLGYPVYLTENCGGDSFLRSVAAETGAGLIPVETAIFMGGAILANARLFISGRYHPSILASLGGTPCIFLGSSAHKMHSLQRILGYEKPREFPVHPDESDLDEVEALARDYLGQGESLRKNIKENAAKRCAEALRLPVMIEESIINH